MKYCWRAAVLDSLVWVGNERGDEVDDKQVRKRCRHLAIDLVDGSWERRRGGQGGGGNDRRVSSLSEKVTIIDDRHRGAAECKSFASRMVLEP